MSRFLTVIWVFTLCQVSIFGAQTSAATITVEDPIGNLVGDPDRGFLDLTTLQLIEQQNTASYAIFISVADAFPEGIERLGSGAQFRMHFLDPSKEAQNAIKVILTLDSRGWRPEFHWPEGILDGLSEDDFQLSFLRQSIRVQLPANFPFSTYRTIQVVSTSEPWPKWRPLTRNPPLILEVAESMLE